MLFPTPGVSASGRAAEVAAIVADVLNCGTFAILTSIAYFVGFVFLDGDLIKHDQAEGAIEAELSAILARLGQNVPAPDPARQQGKQNYAGRIVASIFSCGVYFYWWMYNQMDDVNKHFLWNWPWEDSLASAVNTMAPAA